MAFFNFSNNWESNKTGDELCETFIKDGKNNKKKHRNKNKYKTKLNNIFNLKNEQRSLITKEVVLNTPQTLPKHDNKSSHKILKSKKRVLKNIKKTLDGIHTKVNGRAQDKVPLDSFSFGKFEVPLDSSSFGQSEKTKAIKKSVKRKRSLSETTDGQKIKPLLKKLKIEKKKKNTEFTNDSNSNSIKGNVKNKNKKVKKEGSNGDISQEKSIPFISNHSNEIKKIFKNVETEQIIHDIKHTKKINKKLKQKKKQQLNKSIGESCDEKPLEDIRINPIQLKQRKKQLEKLQHLVLEKQEKLNSLRTKKEEPILTLRQKMMQKLKAARFRFLNEQIYTTTSKETEKIFKSDPDAFKAYHDGYRQQVKRWPLNPLDRIIKSVNKMSKTHVIADFGCGEARLANSVEHKVYSFDLVAANDTVTACDMAHVPLQDSSVDVAVFCLSLMGTNLRDYLVEANRVLKKGGLLKIAEVESRFDDIKTFTKDCEQFGFKKTWMDLSHNLFYFIDFRKESSVKGKKKLPSITLQPCLYKKR